MEDNYVMLVDENGQPYLAHAGGLRQSFQNVGNTVKNTAKNAGASLGRGVRQTHKYIMKVGDAAKPRHLYTQEEVRAYMQGGRQAVTNAANRAGQAVNKTALNAKNAARNVGWKIGEAVDNVKESTGIPAKRRMKESNEALNKANAQWEKDYKTALAAQESRSNLQWEKDEKGDWRRRKLTPEQQRNLNAAKAAEKRAIDKLNDSTEKVHETTEADVKNNKAYRNSPMYAIDKKKEELSKKASELGDNIKSKYDRMREEFKDTADKAKDAGNKAVDKVKDTFRKEPPKAELSPEGTEQIIKEDIIPETIIREDKIHENKVKENITPEKKVVEKVVSEGKLREKSSSLNNKSKYGEYKDNDPDFSDENYAKAKNIGNTDFSSFKRSDGTSVILEEDMKWVLPKGVDANDPAIRKALSDFEDHVASARKLGEDYSAEQWRDAVTEAIDKASEEALKKQKK